MLRLNMAVPPTPRNDPKFSSLGLVQAAVLGLTDPAYNVSTALQFIPNMDGFPNGRRLEDDVTRIELQAVSGIVLAAIGLPYDDFSGGSLVTPNLLNVLTYTTGVETNDTTLENVFPYVQQPWPGSCDCAGKEIDYTQPEILPPTSRLNIATPELFMSAGPNPFPNGTTLRYHLTERTHISIEIYNSQGNLIKVLVSQEQAPGIYTVNWNAANLSNGTYLIQAMKNGVVKQSLKVIKGGE